MSLEMYKQLNEELINKVQELKCHVRRIDEELLLANANYFEEREKRINCELKCKGIMEKLKNKMRRAYCDAVLEFNNEISPNMPIERPRVSVSVINRRSSLGVTMRSPMKTISPTPSIVTTELSTAIAEEASKTGSSNVLNNTNMWGLSNLEERSENATRNSNENTENEPINDVGQPAHETIRNAENISTITNNVLVIPTINITTRRATQIWDRHVLHEIQPSSAASEATSMDNLAADFSQNLCLHSTPRNSETIMQTTGDANKDETDDMGISTMSGSRPRRQCAPKNLSEPSCTIKLRNETLTEKPKRQTKRKKKNK